MVGSSFILTRRHERLTLLNTAQIVSAYTEDIDRTTREGQLRYNDYEPSVAKLYTIQLLLTSRREMEFVFASYKERDSVFEQMQKAVSPGLTLDIAEPLIKQVTLPAKEKFDHKDYTIAELDKAMTMALAQIKRDQEQVKTSNTTPSVPPAPTSSAQPASAAAPVAPIPKPPRKPRAKKGEE